jgi:hypothetical protein
VKQTIPTAADLPSAVAIDSAGRVRLRYRAAAAVRVLLTLWLSCQVVAEGFTQDPPLDWQSLNQLPVRRLTWSATEPLARLTVEHRSDAQQPQRFELPADQIDHSWWRSLRIGPSQRLWLSWPVGATSPAVTPPQLGLEASLEQLVGQSVVVTASRSRSVAGRVMGIESRRVLLQRLDAADQLVQIPINDIEALELTIPGGSPPLADWVGLPSGPLHMRLSPASGNQAPLRLSYTLPPPAWQLRHRLESVEAPSDSQLRLTTYIDLHHVGGSAWDQVELSVGLVDGWQTLGPIDLAVGQLSQWPLGEPTRGGLQWHWQYRLDLNELERSHPLSGSPTVRLSQDARPLAAGVVELVANRSPGSDQPPARLWRLSDTLWPGGEQELQLEQVTGGAVADGFSAAAPPTPRWQVLMRPRARIELRASQQPGVIWRCRTQPLVGELVGTGPDRVPVQLCGAAANNLRIDHLPRAIELTGDAPLRLEFELELDQPEPIDVLQAAVETLERLQREVATGDWYDWLEQLLQLRRQQERAYHGWEVAQMGWRSEQHDRAVSRWRASISPGGHSDRFAASRLTADGSSPAWHQLQAESAALRSIDQQLHRLLTATP